jgi:hypothetical protein
MPNPKGTAALAAFLISIMVPCANAVCTLNIRMTDSSTLAWDIVPGVTTYQVQESFDNYANSRNYFLTAPRFHINHRVSADTRVWYIVTAELDSRTLSVDPSREGCTEQFTVTLGADPEFRTLTRKAVLPIVGSGSGANGGRFKTSLKITGNSPNQRGRLIFHPAGSMAAPGDPSMTYSLGGGIGQSMIVEDIVAQLGQSGVGSLDIVPDADAPSSVPTVEARLFNDVGNGTIGTTTSALYPFDFLQAPTLSVQIPDGQRFRMNMGLRTLTATRAKVLIYSTSGRLREFHDRFWPADSTIIGTPKQVIGADVQPGESVSLFFDGAAIPFYTLTENRTNDPEVFVARPVQSTNVGSYVE